MDESDFIPGSGSCGPKFRLSESLGIITSLFDFCLVLDRTWTQQKDKSPVVSLCFPRLSSWMIATSHELMYLNVSVVSSWAFSSSQCVSVWSWNLKDICYVEISLLYTVRIWYQRKLTTTWMSLYRRLSKVDTRFSCNLYVTFMLQQY